MRDGWFGSRWSARGGDRDGGPAAAARGRAKVDARATRKAAAAVVDAAAMVDESEEEGGSVVVRLGKRVRR